MHHLLDQLDAIQQMLEEIRSGDNARALQAVNTLRKMGWSTIGPLNHASWIHITEHRRPRFTEGMSKEEIRDQLEAHMNDPSTFLFPFDLRGANLSNAKMGWVDLNGAVLLDVQMNEADLSFADLRFALLFRANLRGAWLAGTNLSGCQLQGADLSGAHLNEANLNGADLLGTDFTDAHCIGTMFANTDLSGAKGLDSVKHHGPSIVDVNTLFRSRGDIPAEFLRGCGWPEESVAVLKDLGNKGAVFHCFISHASEDTDFANRIEEVLKKRYVRCWTYEMHMPPGKIEEGIAAAIRKCDVFLLCCSRHAFASHWVDREINNVLQKEKELWKQGRRVSIIVPVDLDGYIFSDEFAAMSLRKSDIQSLKAIDFVGWQEDDTIFNRGVDEAVKAVVKISRELEVGNSS